MKFQTLQSENFFRKIWKFLEESYCWVASSEIGRNISWIFFLFKCFIYILLNVLFIMFFVVLRERNICNGLFPFLLMYHSKCWNLTLCITSRSHVCFFLNFIIDFFFVSDVFCERSYSTKGAAQTCQLHWLWIIYHVCHGRGGIAIESEKIIDWCNWYWLEEFLLSEIILGKILLESL